MKYELVDAENLGSCEGCFFLGKIGKRCNKPENVLICDDYSIYSASGELMASDMTMRDVFAAFALAGFISTNDPCLVGHKTAAELSYKQADAMMEARK